MGTSLLQLLEKFTVVIPILQRDYAQGRNIGKVPAIRERFLSAIHDGVRSDGDPLVLDFVFGYTNDKADRQEFVPLDGQQRLTTLFLLHWYAAAKEKLIGEQETRCLARFTYETRHSSRVFCGKLSSYQPIEMGASIQRTISDQTWFFPSWKKDPTIASMLNMLDAIHAKFNDVPELWSQLVSDEPRITFHLLPMEKLNLPDELYIKMNSRGKELTDFEYFKSTLPDVLTERQAGIFGERVDHEWSDLFWNLYKDNPQPDLAQRVDEGFLRFVRFVTDLLIQKNEIKVEDRVLEFDTFRSIYATPDHADYLIECLERISHTGLHNPGFFELLFSATAEADDGEKIRLFFQSPMADLFRKCADCYDASQRNNPFSIGEQLLLFACLEHLIHDTPDFAERVRVLRNLIANSEDTVRHENLSALLETVSALVTTGAVDEHSRFNKSQEAEEAWKKVATSGNPKLRAIVSRLENHHLLQGCLALFTIDETLGPIAESFAKLFSADCDYETISRALMSYGDYAEKYGWRRRVGNVNHSVWRELFTPSQKREGFDNTKTILLGLLATRIADPKSTPESIVADYLACFDAGSVSPRPWTYYYVKYASFRKAADQTVYDGFFYWPDPLNRHYECMMLRRSTLGGFHWSPFLKTLIDELGPQYLSLDSYGAPLYLHRGDGVLKITTVASGFMVEAANDLPETSRLLTRLREKIGGTSDLITVAQDADGFDHEDRIEKAKTVLKAVIAN